MVNKKSPFIDKQKAVRFQVVHRSQRDPRIADEDASKLVLKQIEPSPNLLKSGKYEPVEVIVPEEEFDDGRYDHRPMHYDDSDDLENDPTLHGIYFDDVDSYDYMQHLKPMGDDPSAFFMESKAVVEKKPKAGGIDFVDEDAQESMGQGTKKSVSFQLPADALPSKYEQPVGLLNQGDGRIEGLGLDLDPSVRQALQALEDEAFVNEDLEDDFFAALDGDTLPEDYEEEVEEDHFTRACKDENEEEWYREYCKYKKSGNSSDEFDSEDESVAKESRGQKYRKAKTSTTNFSMTSSALFRNSQLTLLDDRFDQLMAKEYDEILEEDEYLEHDHDHDYDDGCGEGCMHDHDDDYDDYDDEGGMNPDIRPSDTISDAQLNSIFDNFLDKTEMKGRRLISRSTPLDQMDSIRKELKDTVSEAVKEKGRIDVLDQSDDERDMVVPVEKERDQWDCETIISTYSNIYHHPKFIEETRTMGKIILGKDGLPLGAMAAFKEKRRLKALEKLAGKNQDIPQEQDEDEEDGVECINKGVARRREETAEEKKMRKNAIKEQRRARRQEKKATQSAFKTETAKQSRISQINKKQDNIVHID